MGKLSIFRNRKIIAQAGWFKNTLLLPQRVKSGSIPGFALLYLRSRNHARSAFHTVFFTTQPELFSIAEFVMIPING